MGTKPQARLTSSLLARKGTARPSAATDMFSLPPQAAVDHGVAEDGQATGGRSPEPAPSSPAEFDGSVSAGDTAVSSPTSRKVKNSGLDSRSHGSDGPDPSRTGRIALTLRVDQTRHRRLKVLAAQTRQSSQEILMAALDAYLESVAADMPFCECLRPMEACGKRQDSVSDGR